MAFINNFENGDDVFKAAYILADANAGYLDWDAAVNAVKGLGLENYGYEPGCTDYTAGDALGEILTEYRQEFGFDGGTIDVVSAVYDKAGRLAREELGRTIGYEPEFEVDANCMASSISLDDDESDKVLEKLKKCDPQTLRDLSEVTKLTLADATDGNIDIDKLADGLEAQQDLAKSKGR